MALSWGTIMLLLQHRAEAIQLLQEMVELENIAMVVDRLLELASKSPVKYMEHIKSIHKNVMNKERKVGNTGVRGDL